MMPDHPIAPVLFVIHDLGRRGGQEKLTLELGDRIGRQMPVEYYTCTFEGTPAGRVHRLIPWLRKPILFKSALFHLLTLARLRARRRANPRALIHSAGACSLLSDVVQVHFVHCAWRKTERALDRVLTPDSRPARAGMRLWARRAYHFILRQYDQITERLAFTRRKDYIAVSQRIANELQAHFPALDKVHVVRPGVDTATFRPFRADDRNERREVTAIRSRLGADENDVLVLFVGSYERKGLSLALRAIARAREAGASPLKLAVVGVGDRTLYAAEAALLGLRDQVTFHAPTPHVAEVFRSADIFLLPTHYEPFGMVILEAMASGLPSVVSASAGAAELIEHGHSGYKINNLQNEDETARYLRQLALDPVLRRQLSIHAREVAATRDWDIVANEYEAVLRTIQGRRAH